MNNKTKWLVVAAICLLAIGFALVTTTLTINGNVTVGSNEADIEGNGSDNFGVIFTSATTDDNGASVALISDDRKNITFETRLLTKLNESVTMSYTVANFSRNYDVTTVVTLVNNSTYKNYYTITKDEAWNGRLNAGTTSSGWVKVELTTPYDDVDVIPEIEFKVIISATAVERTTLGDQLVLPASNEFANQISKSYYATKFRYEDDVENNRITAKGIYVYDVANDLNLVSSPNHGYIVVDALDEKNPIYYLYINNGSLMLTNYNVTTSGLPSYNTSGIAEYDATAFNSYYGTASNACNVVRNTYSGTTTTDGEGNEVPFIAPACKTAAGETVS